MANRSYIELFALMFAKYKFVEGRMYAVMFMHMHGILKLKQVNHINIQKRPTAQTPLRLQRTRGRFYQGRVLCVHRHRDSLGLTAPCTLVVALGTAAFLS